jgi:hypothetical protein
MVKKNCVLTPGRAEVRDWRTHARVSRIQSCTEPTLAMHPRDGHQLTAVSQVTVAQACALVQMSSDLVRMFKGRIDLVLAAPLTSRVA